MSQYLKKYNKIKYEGPDSKNKFAFHYYNPTEKFLGKTMKQHLKFAMSWWHTINAGGTDMFGGNTMDKTFGENGLQMYKTKADFGFELMDKLGIEYYCFHDTDIAPEGKTLAESEVYLKEMTNYLLTLQKKYKIKLLWGTANNFSHKMFMIGAATSGSAEVYAIAAGKVKMAIDATIKLGGSGYVFWGGREGYDTLINTDVELELDHLGKFLQMARDYGRKHGFKGDFYIEPKPKEPTKHQYDFDVATCANFLRTYNLMQDFKMNVEANHATLAGHTFQHELRMARVNHIFGSIDANQGDPMLGWDTDQFPTNVYDTTLCMYEVLKAGGFKNGGLNFDAKTRRASNTIDDILSSYISGMDAFAIGLRKAVAIIQDGRLDEFIKNKYSSYKTTPIGKKLNNKTSLDELYNSAKDINYDKVNVPSGQQEYLENLINDILFKN